MKVVYRFIPFIRKFNLFDWYLFKAKLLSRKKPMMSIDNIFITIVHNVFDCLFYATR